MEYGMSIIKSLYQTVFLVENDTSRVLSSYEEVYREVESQLREIATMVVERIWTDEDRYEVTCQFMPEPAIGVIYKHNTVPGLCWVEPMFDEVVLPALRVAGTDENTVDVLTREMRGYIHYDICACVLLIQDTCGITGRPVTSEMVRRYVHALVSHERRHLTQDVREVIITNTDPGSEEYQCQPHEVDANFAALCELRAVIQ